MRLLAASITVACAAVLAPTAPAGASPGRATSASNATRVSLPASEAGTFVAGINGIRAAAGLGGLSPHGEITAVAQAWAQHMASSGGISHNGSLAGQVSAPWTALGENVGVGGDVDSIMQALADSSPHYRNMVNPAYDHVGVGVAWGSDGRLYTCHVFMAMGAPPPPPPPPPTTTTGSGASSSNGSGGGSRRAPAVEEPPPPPPPPLAPAEPARVVSVLAALRSIDTSGLGPQSPLWRPRWRHIA